MRPQAFSCLWSDLHTPVLKHLVREEGNTVACSSRFLLVLQDSKAKKAKSKDKKVPEADKRKKPKKEEEQKWKW